MSPVAEVSHSPKAVDIFEVTEAMWSWILVVAGNPGVGLFRAWRTVWSILTEFGTPNLAVCLQNNQQLY